MVLQFVSTFWGLVVGLEDFPGGSDGKASVYNVGDPGSIPGSGRFPGEVGLEVSDRKKKKSTAGMDKVES